MLRAYTRHRKAWAGVTMAAGPAAGVPAVRLACFDDYAGIAAVQRANGLTPKSREEWEHLWTANPARNALPKWPMGWVLEDPEAGIVGSICNVPFLWRLGDQTLVCASGHGWSVRPAYRGFSLLLLRKYVSQPGVDVLITTSPSATVSALFEKMGWSKVPAGRWDRAAVWVTSYRALARELGTSALNGERGEPRFAPDAPQPVAAGAYCLCWRDAFDSSFDEFWTELRARRPGVLLSCRSRADLEWHFRYGLAAGRVRILTALKGSRLAAYAVFHLRCAEAGVRVAGVADLQMLEPDPALCRAMMESAVRYCRGQGIALIDNAGCWLESAAYLGQRAPYHRSTGTWLYLYRAAAPLDAALRDARHWQPTLFDGDATL